MLQTWAHQTIRFLHVMKCSQVMGGECLKVQNGWNCLNFRAIGDLLFDFIIRCGVSSVSHVHDVVRWRLLVRQLRDLYDAMWTEKVYSLVQTAMLIERKPLSFDIKQFRYSDRHLWHGVYLILDISFLLDVWCYTIEDESMHTTVQDVSFSHWLYRHRCCCFVSDPDPHNLQEKCPLTCNRPLLKT
jgi:hypothetical protein